MIDGTIDFVCGTCGERVLGGVPHSCAAEIDALRARLADAEKRADSCAAILAADWKRAFDAAKQRAELAEASAAAMTEAIDSWLDYTPGVDAVCICDDDEASCLAHGPRGLVAAASDTAATALLDELRALREVEKAARRSCDTRHLEWQEHPRVLAAALAALDAARKAGA